MAEAVSLLLTHGHRLQDIWTYTVQQIFGFVELGIRQTSHQLARLSIAVRMAHHAEGKDYTEFLRSLEQD